MSSATITITDTVIDGQPQINVTLFLEGGFQKDSNAHQHAGLILKHLDELGGMKTKEAVQWVGGGFVPSAEMAVAGEAQPQGLQLDGPDGRRLVAS